MGFRVVEQLQKAVGVGTGTLDKGSQAEVAKTMGAVFVKPQTYMNLSGNAVKAVMKKYDYASLGKKDFKELFVIYDDLDLEVGKYKIVFGSGPKVHNGVNDIKEKLGTEQFWHIRVGVDGRAGDRSVDPQEYVLSGFSKDEQMLIDKVIDSIVDILSQKTLST
jgi:PTH1 family peptidyl-tRNA hydrolase